MLFPIFFMLFFSINHRNMCIGRKEVNYNIDEKFIRRKHQDERRGNLERFQMKRREAFIVTPSFEHKVATLDKSAEDRVLDLILDDNNVNPDVRYTENNDKVGGNDNTYDIDTNMVENYDYDNDYNENIDHKALRNKTDGYSANDALEAMMDVLSKQNKMVEKLVELYQAEIGNKQFNKLIDSINRKQYMKLLNSQPNIARNENKTETEQEKEPEREQEPGKEEEPEKEKGPEKKNDEEKENPVTENVLIRVDEELVKTKLASNPFVRRILRMAQRKKEQYMKRRKEELAQQGNP